MSDIALVAIISVSGALLASIVTAVLSYYITKKQVQARTEEHLKQLEHDRLERRRDRLSLSRKDYLIRLRIKINEYMINSTAFSARITELAQAKENNQDISSRLPEFVTLMQKSRELTDEIQILSGQISDARLYVMVKDIEKSIDDAGKQLAPYIRVFSNSRDVDTYTLQKLFDEMQITKANLHKQTIPISKHIEELLIGDEAK